MADDMLWQVFKDTGDPLCWLIHRAAVKEDKRETAAEDKPQSIG